MYGYDTGVERNRIRNGLVFLVAGVVLLLWACVSWLYRASQPGGPPTSAGAEGVSTNGSFSSESMLVAAGLAFAVLLLLLFGGYILTMRRASRVKPTEEHLEPPPE